MKSVCPEHKGLIEIPDRDISDALKKLSKVMVVYCHICEEEVLINIESLELKK